MKRIQPDQAVRLCGDQRGVVDEGLTREVIAAFYEQYPVGHFRVDLLVEGRLALELEAGRGTVPEDRQQLQNCSERAILRSVSFFTSELGPPSIA
jgi:hypothetical protein